MDSLTDESVSHNFCQCTCEFLGNFFVFSSSCKAPMGFHLKPCLIHLLRCEHHMGLEFLLATGLIKKGSIQIPNGYAVVPTEQGKHVEEEKLKDMIELTTTPARIHQ
jgi:hypothetical protein